MPIVLCLSILLYKYSKLPHNIVVCGIGVHYVYNTNFCFGNPKSFDAQFQLIVENSCKKTERIFSAFLLYQLLMCQMSHHVFLH